MYAGCGEGASNGKTELSEDGNVLIVHRFDVDESGKPFRALEDFCALLGLRPAQKYETTWERIANTLPKPPSSRLPRF